jgi:hypothetical protein
VAVESRGPRLASWRLVNVPSAWVDPLISVGTLPPALDIADDGLAALVNKAQNM